MTEPLTTYDKETNSSLPVLLSNACEIFLPSSLYADDMPHSSHILHNSFVFLITQCLAFTGYTGAGQFVFIFFVIVIILNSY